MEIFSPIWLRQKGGFSRDSWDISYILYIYIYYNYVTMIEDDEIKGRRRKKTRGLLSQLLAFFLCFS